MKNQAGKKMTSKKKLVKAALKNPELFKPAELQYFALWLRHKQEKKDAKIGRWNNNFTVNNK